MNIFLEEVIEKMVLKLFVKNAKGNTKNIGIKTKRKLQGQFRKQGKFENNKAYRKKKGKLNDYIKNIIKKKEKLLEQKKNIIHKTKRRSLDIEKNTIR